MTSDKILQNMVAKTHFKLEEMKVIDKVRKFNRNLPDSVISPNAHTSSICMGIWILVRFGQIIIRLVTSEDGTNNAHDHNCLTGHPIPTSFQTFVEISWTGSCCEGT